MRVCHIWSALSPSSKHPWAVWSHPRGVPLSLFWGTSVLISTAVGSIYIPTSGIEGFPSPTSSPASVVHVLNGGFLTAERQNITAVWISRVVKDVEHFLYFLFIYITILRQCLSVPRWMASNSQGSAAHVSCALLWLKVCTTTPEILKYFIVLFFILLPFENYLFSLLPDSEDLGI